MKRFIEKMKNPDNRRYFYAAFGAKMLGVALLFAMYGITRTDFHLNSAWADDSAPVTTTAAPVAAAPVAAAAAAAPATPPYVNPINTVWVLVTAFLVFFMQAGFMMLEGGFARSRETVNVMLECVVDTCLAGLLFWAFGFAFMFGTGNGFIGHEFFLLHGAPATYHLGT